MKEEHNAISVSDTYLLLLGMEQQPESRSRAESSSRPRIETSSSIQETFAALHHNPEFGDVTDGSTQAINVKYQEKVKEIKKTQRTDLNSECGDERDIYIDIRCSRKIGKTQ